MALNTIADLSTTAGSNVDVLGQNASGSGSANTIDTLFQNLMALMARAYGDQGGLGTVGGSANAITLTSLSTYQSLASGLTLAFKAASANTGATTLNLDGLGAKAVRRQGDSALSANDIVASGRYLVQYDAAYNGAAGAWVLLNASDYASGGADVPLADGGTGASLTDPNADRIMFWDDSAGAVSWLTPGAGLAISGTTLDAATITLGTATATTSGSSIDFTGLPSGVKRFTVNLSGVSTNGSSALIVQIGPTGGVETSSYSGTFGAVNWTSGATVASQVAAATQHGTVTGVLLESSTNTWAITSTMARSDTASVNAGAGSKALAGALSRIRLTTSGGTDTFDAGKVNITYE